jgi:ribonuclease-3 family protein
MAIDRQFQLSETSPDDMRSLAYIGDAVCHLFVRQMLTGPGGHVKGLTERSAGFSSATGQARAVETLLPRLTEEEADIFRRGRNAKCGAIPRKCDPVDYRKATGFEALMGWLYLHGRRARLEELLTLAYMPEPDDSM